MKPSLLLYLRDDSSAFQAHCSKEAEDAGGPGVSRTRDLRFRKPLLYPSELRGQPYIADSFSLQWPRHRERSRCALPYILTAIASENTHFRK